jgi:hypothetical protein
MKGKTILIVLVAVVATAASVYIATRAVSTTVGSGRDIPMAAEAAPGEVQTQVTETAALGEDLQSAKATEPVEKGDRDPMRKYTKPAPPPQPKQTQTQAAAPAKPSFPSYVVTAVLVGDSDPRAWIEYKGNSITVGIGGELDGGYLVTRIEKDGVTVEGPAGERKYPYPS